MQALLDAFLYQPDPAGYKPLQLQNIFRKIKVTKWLRQNNPSKDPKWDGSKLHIP